MSEPTLRTLSRRAHVISAAYLAGKITDDERLTWLREITEPRGFWPRLSWCLFGI